MNLAQIQVQTPQLGFGEQKGIQQIYSQQNQNQLSSQKPGGNSQQQQQQNYQYQQHQQQQQQHPQQTQLPLQNQAQKRKINENQVLIEQQQSQYKQQQDISNQQTPYQKGGNQMNIQQQHTSLLQNQQQLQQRMEQPLTQKTQYQQTAHQYQSSPEKMKGKSSPQQERYQQYQNQTVRSPNHVNQVYTQHQKKHSKIPENNTYQNKKSTDPNQQIVNNNQLVFKPTNEIPKLIEPNPLDCVLEADNELGGLFIGNIDAALSVEILKKSRIRAVLTTSVETGFRYAEESIHFHECLPAHDKEGYDITVHFEKGIEFIERNRKYTSVLVHCFAGVSRSASICIAYMMKKNRWNLEKALWHLKKCRKLINPNTGFIKKLTQYEQYLASKGHFNPQAVQYNGVFDNNPVVSDAITNVSNVNMHDYGGIYAQQNGILTYNLDNKSELPNYSDPNLLYIQQQPNTAQQQQVLLNPNQPHQQVGNIEITQQPHFQQIASQSLNPALQQHQYQLQQQQIPENSKQYQQLQQQSNQQQPLSVIQQVNQLKQTQYQPKPANGGQQQFSGQKQPYGGENNQPLTNQKQQTPSQPVGIQILANNEQFLQNKKQQQAQKGQTENQQQKQIIGQQNQVANNYQQQGVYQQQQGQQSSQQQLQYQQQPISQQVKNKQPIFKQQQQQQMNQLQI